MNYFSFISIFGKGNGSDNFFFAAIFLVKDKKLPQIGIHTFFRDNHIHIPILTSYTQTKR